MIYIQLLESMSLIALAAYIYGQISVSKKDFYSKSNKRKRNFILLIFFTVLSIIGTYTGVTIKRKNTAIYGIANTRSIGAIVAGYIGGPLIGLIVGSIAGFHRYNIGGFTALSCGLSTIIAGLFGGLANKYLKKHSLKPKIGFLVAVASEIFEMIIILVFSKPFEEAWQFEKSIAIPMLLINSIGVVIFICIINDASEQYNRISAIQAQKALAIAEQTLTYLKKGFNEETAPKVAKIIFDSGNFKGVFVANKKKILHYCGKPIKVDSLNRNLRLYAYDPEYRIISISSSTNGNEMLFFFIPIFNESKLEAVIGLRIKSENYVDEYFIQFAKQLSRLLSTQLQIYKLNEIAHEAYIAEYKALMSQIHPHFLFNTLNTIASFCRINPTKARELIIDLSNYFRQTLKRDEDFVTIKEEFNFLNSYLSIENARFGDRLKVNILIDDDLTQYKMPVFVLQPIIENSIKHGILPKPSGGTVDIEIKVKGSNLLFIVKDDGVGIPSEKLKNLLLNSSSGIGLKNVNERLKLLYGEDCTLNITSSIDKGTCVYFSIPKEMVK